MTATSINETSTVVLDVRDLEVTFQPPTGAVHAVRGVSFALEAGEVLGVVGESGSGKSTTFRALLGLTPASADVRGVVELPTTASTGPNDEASALEVVTAELRDQTAMVYQNPGAALNPVFTIGQQLSLAAGDRGLARAELVQLLDDVGLPQPETALDAYPHEFSGGMRQRAVIAMALAKQPAVLIADEPTSALDVTTQQRILDLIDKIREGHGLAVVFISHDLLVVEQIADRIAVMKDGQMVEVGTTADVLTNPQHEYTKALLAASHIGAADAPSESGTPLLQIADLGVQYRSRAKRGEKVQVIDGLNLTVDRGETVALVGESGSGKSTLAHAVVGLAASTGSIRYDGTELVGLSGRSRRPMQRAIQIVFQNPLLSFNPRQRVSSQLEEPMRVHLPLSGVERRERIHANVVDLELDPELLNRFPHELSGGQAQRLVLARALMLEPELIVFDEPTSALDVSVQAVVLDLLARLKVERNLTYLFITHDLAVARKISDRVVVMRQGEIVERAATAELFANPQHEYTKALLSAAQC